MAKIWHIITALKNATGNIIFLSLAGLLVFVLASQDRPSVPESAVMILDPEGLIVEQKRAVDPFEQVLTDDEAEDAETLGRDLIDAVRFAIDDDRIKAIALDLSGLRGSTLTLYAEIAAELMRFRSAGKPVYAFGTSYNQTQYFLASHADKIYVDADSYPMFGGVFLQGFGAYPLYMKAALDKLHVTLHVIKAGLYKDAAETLTRNDMSEFTRASNQALIDTLWGNYRGIVAEQRGLDPDAIDNYINNYDTRLESASADPVSLAIEEGLIDAALSRSDWRKEMKAISGASGDTYQHVGFRQYLAAQRSPIPVENPAGNKVAVIVAKGTIIDGDHPPGTVGGDTIARLIRNARNDSSIKAIVLRVDSPGGTPSASELIRSELALTQDSGKPVVVSMGGYATSGGYWIASTANRIFASESTVTGSIGVFALFPTVDQTLAQLGITSDGVGSNELTGAFDQSRPLNPIMERTLQLSINSTYRKFIELVAEGRGLSLEEADAVGQGRVWAGSDALDNGLVDAIGGLEDAIESAAMLSDVSDYDVVYLEQQLSPREEFIRQLVQSSMALLPNLGYSLDLMPYELKTLTRVVQSPGIYLQCFSCRIVF